MILRTTIYVFVIGLILGLCNVNAQTTRENPVVIWTSSPVKPGETVLLHGGNFGKNPVVELTWNRKKQTVTPISVSESSVMFTYPENWKKGIVSGVVMSGNLVSKPFQINAPDVWWIHVNAGL